jgi:hypothetical protein
VSFVPPYENPSQWTAKDLANTSCWFCSCLYFCPDISVGHLLLSSVKYLRWSFLSIISFLSGSNLPPCFAVKKSLVRFLTDPRSRMFAAYYAEIAGLSYNIQNTASGFQVFLSGYNHKLATLGEKILEKIVSFEVKEERFTVIKVSMAAHVGLGLGKHPR